VQLGRNTVPPDDDKIVGFVLLLGNLARKTLQNHGILHTFAAGGAVMRWSGGSKGAI
jgi:hypothetical protein